MLGLEEERAHLQQQVGDLEQALAVLHKDEATRRSKAAALDKENGRLKRSAPSLPGHPLSHWPETHLLHKARGLSVGTKETDARPIRESMDSPSSGSQWAVCRENEELTVSVGEVESLNADLRKELESQAETMARLTAVHSPPSHSTSPQSNGRRVQGQGKSAASGSDEASGGKRSRLSGTNWKQRVEFLSAENKV